MHYMMKIKTRMTKTKCGKGNAVSLTELYTKNNWVFSPQMIYPD